MKAFGDYVLVKVPLETSGSPLILEQDKPTIGTVTSPGGCVDLQAGDIVLFGTDTEEIKISYLTEEYHQTFLMKKDNVKIILKGSNLD